MKEYKYLRYVVKRNGKQDGQVRERLRKGAAILGQAWGIGKRRFRGDWGKRIWIFDALVWTVMGYGVEVWDWREREEMEKLQERYLRWMLGVDTGTQGYMIREELQRAKLKSRMSRRVWGFERRMKKERGESSEEVS